MTRAHILYLLWLIALGAATVPAAVIIDPFLPALTEVE
jgi:hypothetical protein